MDKLANIREQIQEDIISCCEPYGHVTDGLVTKLCQIVCDSFPKNYVLINADEVDWESIREQKEYLLVCNSHWGSDHIDGLIHFLDFIQDEVATVLGEEAVFGE